MTGCRKNATEASPRFAVLRFENLSGDPKLEWVARASSEYLARSLAGALAGPVLNPSAISRLSSALGPRAGNVPGLSTERAAALAAGATRIISGYVERVGGNVRLEATEIDGRSGRSLRLLSAADGAVMGALARLSHEFSPSAQPYFTSSSEALRLYVKGAEEPPGQSIGDLEAALQLDPEYGPAWTMLVNADIAQGDREGALAAIDRGLHHKLDPFNEAHLELSRAALRNDDGERLTAMRRISALSPGDTVMLRTVAEADARAGEFEHAAGEWNKLAAVLPDDANAWNQLGYTRAWGGDYSGALAAIREYARLRPADPNPLDSTGDMHYMFRKFGEAATSYLQANAKSPDFQNGGDLYKAAWAQFKAGDKTAADKTFAQYRTIALSAKHPQFSLFEADWLYQTGRKQAATALLEKQSDSAAKSQLAVWLLLAGDRAGAGKAAVAAGQPTSPGALLVRFVSLPSASAAEWEKRAAQTFANPAVAPLRQAALGYALLLDNKYKDAVLVWDKIAAGSTGTDFFSRAVCALLNKEKVKLEILPDPNNINPFAALLARLEGGN